MAKKRFSEKDIEELLSIYRSERKKLLFQLDGVRDKIKELRKITPSGASASTEPKVKRGPGRPKGSLNKKTKKSGRRKKRVVKKGGYRLSDWDNVVVNAINSTDRLLTKGELLTHMKKFAAKADPKMKEAEVDAKLTRVLQKLSGKRGVLGTYRSGLQRGYHYGHKDWFFNTSGKLRRQHLDKLDLTKD